MKKSLLDYAIKVLLIKKFRRENPNLNALEELKEFNKTIKTQKTLKQKELKELEFALKQGFKSKFKNANFKP